MKRELIIEDHGHDLEVALRHLREKGFSATLTAVSGELCEKERQWPQGRVGSILDDAPIGIFRSTLDGKFISVNRALARILKYDSPEDLLETVNRRSIADVLYLKPEQRPEVVEDILSHEEWQVYEVRYRCKDGSVITCNDHIRKVPGVGGGKTELEGFVEDITDRKQAENALRLSQFIIDKASIGIFRGGTDAKIRMANEFGAKMLGYTKEEICSMSFFDIDPNLTREFWLEHRKKLTATGRNTFESVHRRKDGTTYPVEVTINYLNYDDQEFSCSFARDITERKLAEETLRKSEDKYRVVADFTYDWETWLAPDGGFIYVSPSCERITGYSADEFIKDPGLLLKIVHTADGGMFKEHYKEILKGDSSVHHLDFRIITRSGEERWIEHICQPVFTSDGKCLGRRASNRDCTDRKLTENVISARLRLLQFAETHTLDELIEATLDEAEALTGSQIGFYVFLLADQKTLSLQNWSTRTKRDYCKAEGKGLHFDISEAGVWVDCVHQRRPIIHNDYASIPHRKGLPPGHAPLFREMVVPVFRGKNIVAILAVGNKALDYNQHDVEMVSLLADLAWTLVEKKHSKDALRESEEKFRVLAETAPTAIVLHQGERFIYTNPATSRFFGYGEAELLEMNFWDWCSEDHKDFIRERSLARLRGEPEPAQYEHKLIAKSGEEKWVLISAGVIEYHGKPTVIATFLDITDAKRAEQKVSAALAEKVVLLKEIHHRVKNNLQVITSLLELQACTIADERLRNYLRESQDRIRSMALIHEQLYKSKDFSYIDFGGYIRNLSHCLFDSYAAETGRISLNIDAADICVGIDRAIPCGLIVNELISNAMKHAFPGDHAGEITVSLGAEKGWINLSVADSGAGMPPGFDAAHSETMGLQLVTTLIRQLGGKMRIDSGEGGTSFVIDFPEA